MTYTQEWLLTAGAEAIGELKGFPMFWALVSPKAASISHEVTAWLMFPACIMASLEGQAAKRQWPLMNRQQLNDLNRLIEARDPCRCH